MLIYKICDAALWAQAENSGVFRGAGIDLADGYIHFSTAGQVRETAAKHFAGRKNLVLIAVDADRLGDDLRWEPSRGGALFPHLYRNLKAGEATWAMPLPLGSEGHVFPDCVA